MNGKIVTYWITTVLVSGWMAYAAIKYLTHDPKMSAGFASLGYPAYFPIVLGTAKLLGVLALLAPGLPRLKEWAYAGFTFTFIGAAWSHLASNQNNAAVMPIATLVLLAISYACRPAESEAENHLHRPIGGLPVS